MGMARRRVVWVALLGVTGVLLAGCQDTSRQAGGPVASPAEVSSAPSTGAVADGGQASSTSASAGAAGTESAGSSTTTALVGRIPVTSAAAGRQVTGSASAASTARRSAAPRPKIVVVVTGSYEVAVLDADTGRRLRTLVKSGVQGQIAVDAVRGWVYFVRTGRHDGTFCDSTVWRVPVQGGRAQLIGPGSAPEVSPDGRYLAHARWSHRGCVHIPGIPSDLLVVRDLATGAEQRYRVPPAVNADGHDYGIGTLSWSAGGTRLVVSYSQFQAQRPFRLAVFHFVHARSGVPVPVLQRLVPDPAPLSVEGQRVPGPNPYVYGNGVMLANGNLLVRWSADSLNCTYPRARCNAASRIMEISPSTGHPVRTLPLTLPSGGKDQGFRCSRLQADRSGTWALLLCGEVLWAVHGSDRPVPLVRHLSAAYEYLDW